MNFKLLIIFAAFLGTLSSQVQKNLIKSFEMSLENSHDPAMSTDKSQEALVFIYNLLKLSHKKCITVNNIECCECKLEKAMKGTAEIHEDFLIGSKRLFEMVKRKYEGNQVNLTVTCKHNNVIKPGSIVGIKEKTTKDYLKFSSSNLNLNPPKDNDLFLLKSISYSSQNKDYNL